MRNIQRAVKLGGMFRVLTDQRYGNDFYVAQMIWESSNGLHIRVVEISNCESFDAAIEALEKNDKLITYINEIESEVE